MSDKYRNCWVYQVQVVMLESLTVRLAREKKEANGHDRITFRFGKIISLSGVGTASKG